MADSLVDLVTLTEVTNYLTSAGLSAPGDLDQIITGVSAAMQSYASRNFVSQPYTVTWSGHGGTAQSVQDTPITAVASVSVDGVSIPAASSPTASGFVFSDDQIVLRGYRFTRGVQNVTATFTAGFTPGSAPGQMPADIRRATCEAISAVINQLEIGDSRITEAKSGGTSLKYGTLADLAALCLTPAVTQVLNQRARVHPC